MFGTNKSTEEPRKTTLPASSGTLNALVKTTDINGNIRCDSDLRIDGHIKGNVTCGAKVIIGPTGSVHGEVKCQNAVVEGKFNGKLKATELLHVRETAVMDGEISTNKLLVQSGAKFNVICNMENGSVSNGVGKPMDIKVGNNSAETASKALAGVKS
jgi:cytoskeletal protein CcmA (bactofilin family)